MGVNEVIGPFVAPTAIRKGLRERFRGRGLDESFIARRIAAWDTPKVTNAIAFELGGTAAGLAQRGEAYHAWLAERMHDDIPGSSIRLVPGTGHFIQFERTERSCSRSGRRPRGRAGAAGRGAAGGRG